VWQNRSSNVLLNWTSFFAEKEFSLSRPVCTTSLLPLFDEKSTDPSMVYHAMLLVKNSTDYVNPGQTAVMTCDQPIYAVAKQLQWSTAHPKISEDNFFLLLGGLHLEKSCLKLVGEVLKDSEWTLLLAGSGIFTSGVAESLLSASHIKKTRRSHQLTLAALHVLKMKAFECRANKLVEFDEWNEANSEHFPMFFFWSLVMELETIVLGFIRSIRSQNWKMYCKYLKLLCPWFFALNHHHYARWTSVHIRDIAQLEATNSILNQEFDKGKFTVKKSDKRFSAMAMDQNHEQCNATVKGRGGVIGLFHKQEALNRWMISQPMVLDLIKEFEEEITFKNEIFKWSHHEESCSHQDQFSEELDCLIQVF